MHKVAKLTAAGDGALERSLLPENIRSVPNVHGLTSLGDRFFFLFVFLFVCLF